MAADHNVYLIDAPVYVFRAYFSLPESLVDPDGQPVNAVYGYTQFLCSVLTREHPTYIAAAFDESLTTSFRNQWYEHYKANREEPPSELKTQFGACKRITKALGVPTYSSTRYEADDIIATITGRAHDAGLKVTILSRDKDLAQLLEPGDRLWDGSDGPRLTSARVRAKFGVKPAQIADYLALVGDSIDNIPGVPGIGPKAATRLLQRFKTIEGIYEKLEYVAQMPLRGGRRVQQQLDEHREQALLSLRLARLHPVPRIRCEPERLVWRGPKARSISRLFRELGFGDRLKSRCLKSA